MQQRLPPSVIRALAIVAAVSFVVGLLLEQTALNFLQRHPYIVNLLSGMTGFSASALVAAVLFNRATTTERTRQWQRAMMAAIKAWQERIQAMEALVEAPSPEPLLGEDQDAHLIEQTFGLGAAVLTQILHEHGGFGIILSDQKPLPKEMPFRGPGSDTAFLGEAQALVEQVLDPMLKAFDAVEEPEVGRQVAKLRSAVNGHCPGEGSPAFQVTQAICWLAQSLRQHPNYRAYMRRWELGSRWSFERLAWNARQLLRPRW